MSYIWVSSQNNELYCPQIQLNLILFVKNNEQILVYCARSTRKIFVRGGTKVSVGGLKILGMGGTGLSGGDNPLMGGSPNPPPILDSPAPIGGTESDRPWEIGLIWPKSASSLSHQYYCHPPRNMNRCLFTNFFTTATASPTTLSSKLLLQQIFPLWLHYYSQ